MRIATLDLLAYGPFRGLSLDFSAPGLHVVFGPNEAGKSTTLRAIAGLLYGIDHVTTDAHLHKPADLRIGGTLIAADGEKLRVVRRKGSSQTLLDDRGKSVDEAALQRFVRAVSKQTFRLAFGLDHITLGEGAKALLEGRGDLGESLFDASIGGGGEVQRLLAELTKEADGIWRPRGSALPLNEALKAYAEAQKAVRDKESRPEAHVAQERELRETQAAKTERAREKSDLLRRRAELDRAVRRVPLERRHAALVAERAPLTTIAAEAAAVSALEPRIADARRALEARTRLEAERVAAEARVGEASRHAGVTGEPLAEARLDGPREARIQRLVAERAVLEDRIASARVDVERNVRARERLERERASLGEDPSRDRGARALVAARDRARALGDLEERSASEAARTAARRKDLEGRGAALGGHSMALDDLVTARLPLPSDVEVLVKRAIACERACERIEEQLAKVDGERTACERQIAESEGDFRPPSANDLRAARAERNRAWELLVAATDATRAHAATEFERAMRDADALADRMLGEADRVTALARLRLGRDHLLAQHAALTSDLETHRAARAAIDRELASTFEAAGVTATSPEAMKGWLERHARLVEDHATLVEHELSLVEARARIEDVRRELVAALAEADGASTAPTASVAQLLAEVERRLSSIEGASRAIEESSRARARLEEADEERRSALALDEAKLARVVESLHELVAPLGLPRDASADEIARGIEATRELFVALEARARASAASGANAAVLTTFAEEIRQLASRIAPDLAAAPPLEAALALTARAARVAELERSIAVVKASLAELGEQPVGEEAAALAVDPAAAARALEDVESALEVVEQELSTLTHRIGGIEKGIAMMRGESHAADAALEAQEALARVRTIAERWARAKLGAVLLAREIERYREENQGPLLGRASALFARLTLGAFTSMKAGFDERDRPALRFVREGGAEVDVSALSAGTRDQLYLSLRLASLLRFAEIAGPMPLVLDDVLVHFDDERSAAALSVLAEVSQSIQVLFFTHHARLVDLARRAVPPGLLVVHELQGRSPAAVPSPSLSR